MPERSVLIRVPSTVGNFGGAVNSAAMALEAPLNVKVTPRLDGHVGIRYFGDNGERVPRDRSNLVVRTFEAALHFKGVEFTGANFEIYSSVPVGVGLGSSAAAVLAGLIAGDRLYHLQLDEKNLFDLAALFEMRSDNLQAAWYGGFVAKAEEAAVGAFHRTAVPEDALMNVVVPESYLASPARSGRGRQAGARSSRKVNSLSFARAQALAKFFAEPAAEDRSDLLAPLPPTCEKVVPGLEGALKVRVPGLVSVFVCGSGPAVGILAKGNPAPAVQAVRECFSAEGVKSSFVELRPTNAGAREWNAPQAELSAAAEGLGPSAKKFSLIPV